MNNAIDIGSIYSCGKTYSDGTRNNNPINCFGNEYGQTSDDIYYKFTLLQSSTVSISTCGPNQSTYVYLLSAQCSQLASSTNCNITPQINKLLAAGTYYIVAENLGSLVSSSYTQPYGQIYVSLNVPATSSAPEGAVLATAINFKTLSCGVIYSDTKNNSSNNCFGNDYGQPSDDIYYKFTLQTEAMVAISHCGGFDTYLYLLNSTGSLLYKNDDGGPLCASSSASIRETIPAGTYYIVSEGYGLNSGSITTTVTASVSVKPLVSIAAASSTTIEPGASLVLSASGACSYEWTSAAGLSATTGASVTVTPPVTTTYTVIGRSTTGVASDPVSITVTVAQNQNAVYTTTVLERGITTVAAVTALEDAKKLEQVVYYDGLGRPMQEILIRNSPKGKDLVVPIIYDALGRNSIKYLPYSGGVYGLGKNGFYQPDALTQQAAFYGVGSGGDKIANDVEPYSRTSYEESPLNRVIKQGAPGAAWQPGTGQDHTIKLSQRTNAASEVRSFNFTGSVISSSGFYTAGELLVQEKWDEHDGLISEYTDKQGLVVLKKVVSSSSTICGVKAYYTGDLVLTAPSGMRITGIQSATFGTGSGSTTSCSSFTFGTCKADVTSQVANAIASQITSTSASITVRVNVDYLGDPCYGDLKHLMVVATCVPISGTKDMLTYYAYDDLNRLRLIIPPAGTLELPASGTWAPDAATLASFKRRWCFSYEYDSRGRVTEKQMPGTGKDPISGTGEVNGAVYMAYNQRNQLVLTQDAIQRPANKWTFIKYDELGRPILTGIVTIAGKTLATIQAELEASTETVFVEQRDATSTVVGYTLTAAYPHTITEADLLNITYYDDYTPAPLAKYAYENGSVTRSFNTRGQVTGTRIRQLTGATNGIWLTAALYYDDSNRLLQSYGNNALIETNGTLGTDRTTNEYDFTGRMLATSLAHVGYGVSRTIHNEYAYDKAGRLLRTTQNTANQGAIVIAQNEYNELGQLVDKKLHSPDWNVPVNNLTPTYLQSVDYRYNIRGWLTNINDRNLSNNDSWFNDADPNADNVATEKEDLFGMELMYDKNQNLNLSPAQYNGNISEVMWRTRNTATNNTLRGYAYKYDHANRITDALYRTYEGQGSWGIYTTDFSVSGITYDLNGNLAGMTRQGTINGSNTSPQKGILDQLKYFYVDANGKLSNRLLAVDDAVLATTAAHDFEDKGNIYGGIGSAKTIEYAYDNNGNLISDLNKGITQIEYNYLNLPYKIVFGSSGNRIEFTYTASGNKLQKKVYTNTALTNTTDYSGPFIYENGTPAFVQTSEGRALYIANRSTYKWKYEYHLKDHLGNLRFAFRESDATTTTETQLTAGMEPANSPQEEHTFAHVRETRVLDAVHARTGNYVARLNAHDGRRQGPSVTIAVAAGDSVYMQVFGRYEHDAFLPQSQRKKMLWAGAVVGAVPVAPGKETTQGSMASARWRSYLGASLTIVPSLIKLTHKQIPTAFLRYECFNQDSQLVATKIKPLQRTATDAWQQLALAMKADSAGYVEISLVNESGTPAYFDDLTVQPADPTYFQENHYDPWGLNLVGIETSSTPNANFQYNDKEKQEEFGLNWLDYGARNYDAQLGRWHTADAFASEFSGISPYNYVANNPIKNTDVGGAFILSAADKIKYPRLAKFLSEVVPLIALNPVAMNTIKSLSLASDTDIATLLNSGTGPQIESHFNVRYGQYDRKDDESFENTIKLSEELMDRFENYLSSNKINTTEKRAIEFIVSVTIIHESIHYLRALNKQPSLLVGGAEAGHSWERAMFGKFINTYDGTYNSNEAFTSARQYIHSLHSSNSGVSDLAPWLTGFINQNSTGSSNSEKEKKNNKGPKFR